MAKGELTEEEKKYFQDKLDKAYEGITSFMRMPIGEKLQTIDKYKSVRKNLEDKICELDAFISDFERDQEVLEHKIREDKNALSVFAYLRRHEKNLVVKCPGCFYDFSADLFDSCLEKLQKANLIQYGKPDVKITDLGMKFKY